ncbi:MAG TPA: glyoxalase [Terriglobia bacterium]|nr:glyoxalase [Terriglobia bacterium]
MMRKTYQAMIIGTGLAGALLALTTATATAAPVNYAVGPQYDTTHVYLDPADYDKFMTSFQATFGGTLSKQVVATVTPTPSSTISQLALTPAGTVSAFGYKTPAPYPFGAERTGYLVTKLDEAVKAAHKAGASVIVAPFDDPIGRDAVIQWPGGVNMQLYWHTTPPDYPKLATIPENRVYVSPDKQKEFVKDFLAFSQGKIVSDEPKAPGIEIGRANDSYHRIRIDSLFGKMTVLATDGHLPYPYGLEMTGYEVADLNETLDKAKASGAKVLVEPYTADHRKAALVEFPGGYIAEIHATAN